MPASSIYDAFKRTSCISLGIQTDIRLRRAVISKVRRCLSGRRRNFPYVFATSYSGRGEERIGVSAGIYRKQKNEFMLSIRWFETTEEPPKTLGHLRDLLNCLSGVLRDKEVLVLARFSYGKEGVISLFKPIQVGGQYDIFDEIIGFTGIKRDSQGKVLYQMEVSHGTNQLIHSVQFTQAVTLVEELQLPVTLIDTASKISALALKAKES